MKKSIAIAMIVCGLSGTAGAQDDLEETDTTEETTTETTETTAETTTTTTEPAASGAAAGHGYQWGIEASLNSAGDLDAVHLLYNLGGNYLDAAVGFNLTSAAETGWELELEIGYRMQRTLAGRIQPYIKPLVLFSMADEGEADTLLGFGIGGAFGVDFELFPQFTLGTEVGAALTYVNTDPDATINVGLVTAALNATFWW